jgi:hypothetical protein
MRKSYKVSSFALTLAAVAFTAIPALADPPPTTCSTLGVHGETGPGHWTVSVTEGPCNVSCSANQYTNPFCTPAGECTGIEYMVTGSPLPSRVVTLVRDVEVVFAPGTVAAPCVGDETLDIGEYDCSSQAIRLDGSQRIGNRYRVVVAGHVTAVNTSVAVKKTDFKEACKIAGLGAEPSEPPPPPESCVNSCGPFHPKQMLTSTEEMAFGDCKVKFVHNLLTGEIISAALTEDSPEDCDFYDSPVEDLHITLGEGEGAMELGAATIGLGFVSTGSDSCTSRVIGGRVYSWGNPCP